MWTNLAKVRNLWLVENDVESLYFLEFCRSFAYIFFNKIRHKLNYVFSSNSNKWIITLISRTDKSPTIFEFSSINVVVAKWWIMKVFRVYCVSQSNCYYLKCNRQENDELVSTQELFYVKIKINVQVVFNLRPF